MKLTQVTFSLALALALAMVAGAAPALVVLDQDGKPDGSGAGLSVSTSTASSRPGPGGAVPGAATSGNFSIDRGFVPSVDDVGAPEPASFAMWLAGMLAAGGLVRSRMSRA